MKTQFNITSMKWDLERYTSVEDFATALEGFDGVELMDYGMISVLLFRKKR